MSAQPFTITIIGGQRKWYQPVADELSIELIHDTGDYPKRILADLKRSQEMFMIIECVSHNATWMCVEFAKRHGIHFQRLTGSRSQLKEILLHRLGNEERKSTLGGVQI